MKGAISMKEEVKLWYSFLRDYKLKFHRFFVIDRYITDFYCKDAKLAIELCEDPKKDKENKKAKTKLFESMGIKLVFIEKSLVLENFEHVCDVIDYFAEQRVNK